MTYIPSTSSTASVSITGGSLDNMPVGATTPASLSVKSLTNTGSAIDAVRVITSGATVTQLATDHILIINKLNGSPTTVNLLSSPATGLRLIIKDGVGDAALNPIRIVPATTIDGASAITIQIAYGCVEVCYMGSAWTMLGTIGVAAQQVISPPAIVESTDGTIITTATQTMYSSQSPGFIAPVIGPFDTYALTANPGQIVINGATDASTANVVKLVYHNHSTYQQIVAGNWWKRVLVTTTSSNLIANSSNQGAVVGAITGVVVGALPNTWNMVSDGLTVSIVNIGTDTTTGSSLPYIDIQFSGTTTGTQGYILFNADTAVSASTAYNLSGYIALVGGALTNLSNINILWNEDTAAHGYLATVNNQFTPTGTLLRYTATATTQATTATLQPQFIFTTPASAAVNVTFRFAGLQLSTGTTPTTFISTPVSTIAWQGTTDPTPTVLTMNISPQVDRPVGSAFTVTGTLGAYTSAPTLQYQDNGGTWQAMPNPVVSTTTWSFLHPSVGSVSNLSISVRDANSTLVSATSNTFQIYTPGVVTITGITLTNTTFLGSSVAGTVIGTVNVLTSGGTFTGSLTLGGGNAASFTLTGNTLKVGATQPPVGTYSISITATM